MEYLSYLIVAFVAMWCGWHLRGVFLIARMSQDPQHFINILKNIKQINDKEAEEEAEKIGTELNIERHGEMLYAFVKDTNQFIAQGNDLNTLLDQAKQRFPNRKFFGVIDKNNPAKELA